MRTIGRTIHIPVAAALFAGATLLLGPAKAAETAKDEAADEVAMAIPRMSPFGDGGGVAWPRPLDPSEASRIRRVFSLQSHGALDAASRAAAELDTASPLGQAMLGVITAHRYLGRFSHPSVADLRGWLARWSDLADASAIHALLLSRLPRGVTAPPPPVPVGLGFVGSSTIPLSPPVPEETGPALRALARNAELDRSIGEAARRRGPEGVRRLLARTSGLSGAYASQLLGEAARVLFTQSRDEDAYELASEGLHACARWPNRDCTAAASAGFVGGLAAWRMDRPERARSMFEAAWRSELTTSSLRAAAAYWAARTHLQSRDAGPHWSGYLQWLRRAAMERDTFYGLLAQRNLGAESAWYRRADTRELLGQADVDAVAAIPEGLRAFALLQVDQPERAEAELRRLWPAMADQPEMARAVMLVADHAGMSELAAQLADLLQSVDGRPREATRFSVPRLRPRGGFQVDPSMVFAIARTESNFSTHGASSAGALGVMQIMPETADFITAEPVPESGRKRHVSGSRLREMLVDPSTNLDLGQRYIDYLARREDIDGNLIHLLASYDCGPGRFAQWSGQVDGKDDPLLFIEAIPIDETRAYVPRVLTYTWLYARRLRRPTPSLDELAAGIWPRYRPLAGGQVPPLVH